MIVKFAEFINNKIVNTVFQKDSSDTIRRTFSFFLTIFTPLPLLSDFITLTNNNSLSGQLFFFKINWLLLLKILL